jgi:nicotinate dehydrogenase subunit A
MAISFMVNGTERRLDVTPDVPLLYALRNDLGLNGPKFGCGLSQCGACTVLVNGDPIRSCVTPVAEVAGSDVVTLEGLGNREAPHPLQTAFIEEQAMQCGYCVNGIVMTAAALLRGRPEATEAEIRTALADVLCRCGAHTRMLRAVLRAAEAMKR